MIKSFAAFTHEVDDVEAAIAQLLETLDIGGKNPLLKNTVGIISCYSEYIDSGVYAAVCEQLPFDVIGCTTIEIMTAGEMGDTMLALIVLTSDDVSFATGLSQAVTNDDAQPLKPLYNDAAAKLPGKPAFMLSYAPLLTNFGSDFYVEQMSKISGNVPNFGTLAVDHNQDYHESRVLLNGEAYADRFAVLLIHGDVKPTFLVGAISDEKVFAEKGVVTASAGNQLQMVNELPAVDYLQSLGLSRNEDGGITGINSFPIIVDYNDGTTPVVRAMFAVTPDGHVVCGGNIPVGSTLSMGSFDPEEIAATTERTLETVANLENKSVILMYSCVGRYFAQGYNPRAELEKVAGRIDPGVSTYLAAYSGGELCPVYGRDGNTVNRNHNNTFVVCAF